MADFCRQCSIELFDEDHRDLAGLAGDTHKGDPYHSVAICEGCGLTLVDEEGKCVFDCLKKHALHLPLEEKEG